jgi:hypothetical protein
MDRTRIKLIGKQLRKAYVAPVDLPDAMREALERLAAKEAEQESEDFAADQRRKQAK